MSKKRPIDAVALSSHIEIEMSQYGEEYDAYQILSDIEDFPTLNPWHSVEDGLPPNAKHRGAFCPKYRVMTKWGVTDGWFNPDVGENGAWRVLLWFFQGTWDEWDIDFERGDKPKLAWVSQRDVFAWMPIEPPKNNFEKPL